MATVDVQPHKITRDQVESTSAIYADADILVSAYYVELCGQVATDGVRVRAVSDYNAIVAVAVRIDSLGVKANDVSSDCIASRLDSHYKDTEIVAAYEIPLTQRLGPDPTVPADHCALYINHPHARDRKPDDPQAAHHDRLGAFKAEAITIVEHCSVQNHTSIACVNLDPVGTNGWQVGLELYRGRIRRRKDRSIEYDPVPRRSRFHRPPQGTITTVGGRPYHSRRGLAGLHRCHIARRRYGKDRASNGANPPEGPAEYRHR